MAEILVPVLTSAFVGLFTLGAVLLQNRHHATESTKRMTHERLLAHEDFQREKIAAQNDGLVERIYEQLSWGERIAVTVARTKIAYGNASTREERTEARGKVAAVAGISMSGYYPLASLLEPDLLEDDQLRGLVSQHRNVIEEVFTDWWLVSDYEPDLLPDDHIKLIDQVKNLRKRIELRIRDLVRQGAPL